MPLGGIGTGTVSLGGRGDLRDWEIMNRPAKGFVPVSQAGPFVALRVTRGDGVRFVRALEGPLDPAEYEGSHGSTAPNHGLPRFREASFAAAYPLAQVLLRDPDCPVEVRLEAFNPLIPTDAEASGLPVAVLRYALHNPGDAPLAATVCASLPNFIGNDGSETRPDWKGDFQPVGERENRNRFRAAGRLRGIFMDSTGVDPRSPAWGTLALVTTADDRRVVPHRLAHGTLGRRAAGFLGRFRGGRRARGATLRGRCAHGVARRAGGSPVPEPHAP
jgi:non-lysosomal glucosylceramidase